MGLPWVRLDANIAAHDKVLALLADPSPKRWQAAASYMFAIGWVGGAGTDGQVPAYALPAVHGTAITARLLEKYGLWVEGTGYWFMPNWDERQEMSAITEAKKQAGDKGNCIRWHGTDCGCWKRKRPAT